MFDSLQPQFEHLLETEIDRREFLAHCGATLLAVVGVSNLLKTLTQSPMPRSQLASKPVAEGYGTSTYGGRS